MLNSAAERARRLGLPFDLVKVDIEIPDVCPALGIPLLVGGQGVPDDNSPSLDRLVPSLGYVRDNVVVVSVRANRIKNDSTIEELEAVASFFARHIAPAPSPRKRRNPA
jgi:hypothetical protein